MTAADWLTLTGALLILVEPTLAAALVWLLLPPSVPAILRQRTADSMADVLNKITICWRYTGGCNVTTNQSTFRPPSMSAMGGAFVHQRPRQLESYPRQYGANLWLSSPHPSRTGVRSARQAPTCWRGRHSGAGQSQHNGAMPRRGKIASRLARASR
jgi:hypothetical protein